jgi:two-component system CheB/CheR fusion protein
MKVLKNTHDSLKQGSELLLQPHSKPKYIIAIGGSTVFLKPLITFFDHTPTDDVSYVVLRHIGINVQSHLASILQKHSALEIVEVKNNIEIENNKVYILPAGFYMTIENGRFHLQRRLDSHNCAIDIFLESLASEFKNKAIGIILSGAGRNGTKSIVKKGGGTVLVQKPSSCEFEYMPESAINSGCVDYILLPEEMPGMIKQCASGIYQ